MSSTPPLGDLGAGHGAGGLATQVVAVHGDVEDPHRHLGALDLRDDGRQPPGKGHAAQGDTQQDQVGGAFVAFEDSRGRRAAAPGRRPPSSSPREPPGRLRMPPQGPPSPPHGTVVKGCLLAATLPRRSGGFAGGPKPSSRRAAPSSQRRAVTDCGYRRWQAVAGAVTHAEALVIRSMSFSGNSFRRSAGRTDLPRPVHRPACTTPPTCGVGLVGGNVWSGPRRLASES